MNQFDIRVIYLDPRSTSEDQFGGDSDYYSSRTNKRAVISLAKKLSKLKEINGHKLHEVMVIQETEGDPTFQEYYANGKMKFKMF